MKKHFLPTIAKICYKLNDDLIFTTGYELSLKGSLQCDFFHQLFTEMQKQRDLDTQLAGQLTERSEQIVRNHTDEDEFKNCAVVVSEMTKRKLKKCENGAYLWAFDNSWQNFQRSDPLFSRIVFPYLVKKRYGGNSKNATRLINFFRDVVPSNQIHQTCESSRVLAQEMKKHGRLASFEFISLLSQIQLNIRKFPSDCFDFSLAPGWMNLIFPNVSQTCNLSQDPICAESVVNDLSSILEDFKERNENATKEILAIDFVIKYLRNQTSDKLLLRNLTLLELVAEPFLEQSINEMKTQFVTETFLELDLFRTIYNTFDRNVYRFYLLRALRSAEKIDVAKCMRDLDDFVDQRDDFCFSMEALYLELKRRSQLNSTKELQFFNSLKRSRIFKSKSSVSTSECRFVLENLGNLTEKPIIGRI